MSETNQQHEAHAPQSLMVDVEDDDRGDALLSSLKARHLSNVLKTVYADAAKPGSSHGADRPGSVFEERLHTANGDHGPAMRQPEWRGRVSSMMRTNRVPSAKARSTIKHFQKAIKPVHELNAPRLTVKPPTLGEKKMEEKDAGESRPGPRTTRYHSLLMDLQVNKNVLGVQKVENYGGESYTLPKDSKQLYSITTSEATQYPLEVFDDLEGETHTPDEWIALGQTQDGAVPSDSPTPEGTPAMSLYYMNQEWHW